jgi:hypothetical protein
MKTYSAGTRTLACIASHADTITQNLGLHGMMGAKAAGSSSGSGGFQRGKNYQPKSVSGRGRQSNYSNKDVNVAAVDRVVRSDGVNEVDDYD